MPSGNPVLLTTGRSLTVCHERDASASPSFFSFAGGQAIARPLRINDQIRIRTVRVIDEDSQQLGVMPTENALMLARQKGLDLIEVSPTAVPPVCRISDYGRLKYEQSKKDKDARKKQKNWELREVKLRPKIETHDYEVKARMAERLLQDGGKVKVTIMFRGREITYTSFGKRLLDRMAADMTNIAILEREAKLEGKNMFMILAPRAVPLGPPKFTHVKDSAVEAAAKKDAEEEAAEAARGLSDDHLSDDHPSDDHPSEDSAEPADVPEPVASPAQAV
jgi:translation initiation factor IF-3